MVCMTAGKDVLCMIKKWQNDLKHVLTFQHRHAQFSLNDTCMYAHFLFAVKCNGEMLYSSRQLLHTILYI
jgi:hypothetical protein